MSLWMSYCNIPQYYNITIKTNDDDDDGDGGGDDDNNDDDDGDDADDDLGNSFRNEIKTTTTETKQEPWQS